MPMKAVVCFLRWRRRWRGKNAGEHGAVGLGGVVVQCDGVDLVLALADGGAVHDRVEGALGGGEPLGRGQDKWLALN